jgi:hypothetical protein
LQATTPKVVNSPTRLETYLVSICEPRIPRICFVKKPIFANWPSYIGHQANGFAHVDEEIKSLLNNKDNSPMTNVQKDSSIEAPTPNMFPSNSSPATSIVTIANVLIAGFSRSKHTIRKGTTT